MTPWIYNHQPFTDSAHYYGMIYIITNKLTGKQYIGKKFFTKAKIQQKTKTRRKKKLRVKSDWETYFGSSSELLNDIRHHGDEHFHREILHLCVTRGETNYMEAHEIVTRRALLSDRFYNKWISLKLHKSTLAHLQSHSSENSDTSSISCSHSSTSNSSLQNGQNDGVHRNSS